VCNFISTNVVFNFVVVETIISKICKIEKVRDTYLAFALLIMMMMMMMTIIIIIIKNSNQ